MTDSPAPDDDLGLSGEQETRIRQDLVLTALGKRPADRIVRVGRRLDVFTGHWEEDCDIVVKGHRIAWVGPVGTWPGDAREDPRLRLARGGTGLRRGAQAHRKHAPHPGIEAALVLPHVSSSTGM